MTFNLDYEIEMSQENVILFLLLLYAKERDELKTVE